MQRYRVVNLLGQITQPHVTQAQIDRATSQVQRQQLPCPPIPKDTSKLNCVATRDGGVICSDGTYYPPGCGRPPITEPDFAPYEVKQGFLFPKPPPAHSLTEEVGGTFPVMPLVIAVVSLVGTIIFS